MWRKIHDYRRHFRRRHHQHRYRLGFTAAEAVGCQLDTTKASVLSHSGPFAICGGQSGTGRAFSPST